MQGSDGGGTFRLLFWNLHKIWIEECINLNSVQFGRRCIIGWVTRLVPSGGQNWPPWDSRVQKLSFEPLISLMCASQFLKIFVFRPTDIYNTSRNPQKNCHLILKCYLRLYFWKNSKTFFSFFDTKIFLVFVVRGQFSH